MTLSGWAIDTGEGYLLPINMRKGAPPVIARTRKLARRCVKLARRFYPKARERKVVVPS